MKKTHSSIKGTTIISHISKNDFLLEMKFPVLQNYSIFVKKRELHLRSFLSFIGFSKKISQHFELYRFALIFARKIVFLKLWIVGIINIEEFLGKGNAFLQSNNFVEIPKTKKKKKNWGNHQKGSLVSKNKR